MAKVTVIEVFEKMDIPGKVKYEKVYKDKIVITNINQKINVIKN